MRGWQLVIKIWWIFWGACCAPANPFDGESQDYDDNNDDGGDDDDGDGGGDDDDSNGITTMDGVTFYF